MNKDKTRKLVISSMLGAVTIVLGLTPLGFIPLGLLNATTMHIPVIIAAILEGPIVGAAVGLIFGISSMVKAFTMPMPTSFVFWNPLIAIVPRILIGVVAYYVYAALKNIQPKFLKVLSIVFNIAIICFLANMIYRIFTADKLLITNLLATLLILITFVIILFININMKFENFALSAAAFCASLTNSVLVLGGIYLFYAEAFVMKIGQNPNMAGRILMGIGVTSSIPEAIVAVLVTVVSISTINKLKNR